MGDMDLPPSDDEVEFEADTRAVRDVDLSKMATDKDSKKKAVKDAQKAARIAEDKRLAMVDEDDAFTVRERERQSCGVCVCQCAGCVQLTEGRRGGHTAQVRLARQVEEMDLAADLGRDIKVEGFSVMAKGKELMKNTTFNVVHGRRYGLVGPNGKGKSTLLRLLARRQIPVPKFIDVLLVEQEVIGDDRTALKVCSNLAQAHTYPSGTGGVHPPHHRDPLRNPVAPPRPAPTRVLHACSEALGRCKQRAGERVSRRVV